jgi:hypothetical protein
VHVGLDAARLVERPAADEADDRARVLAVDRDLARRTAPDSLGAPVVARKVDRLRLAGDQLDPVRLDQQVDHERAPGLALAVQAVAAVCEQRLRREPVADSSAGAATLACFAHLASCRRPEKPL